MRKAIEKAKTMNVNNFISAFAVVLGVLAGLSMF